MKSKRWRIKNFNIAKSKVGNDKPLNFVRIYGIFKFNFCRKQRRVLKNFIQRFRIIFTRGIILPLVECPYIAYSGWQNRNAMENRKSVIQGLYEWENNESYEKIMNKVATVVMLELFDAFLATRMLACSYINKGREIIVGNGFFLKIRECKLILQYLQPYIIK